MEEKVTEILSALQGAVTDLAPEAWTALVIAAQVTAIRNVVLGSLAALWFATYARIAIRRVIPYLCSDECDTDAKVGPRVGFLVIGGVAALFCFMAAMSLLSGTDTWLGLISPESQVVRELLNSVK